MSEGLEIVCYDDQWPRMFAAERGRLADTLGRLALRIDHNGSTSVPGLSAKPIIDIQISVLHLQPLTAYAVGLTRLGYAHLPDPDDSFCPFFHRPAVWPHTHHVHVVESGGIEERKTLAFRDYLREHSDAAREYEALKKRLLSQLGAVAFSAQSAYADGKSEFVSQLTERALAEGYPRRL
jgi:GrpB-like predicted nucleotidyltransferase (UPF0157 family)